MNPITVVVNHQPQLALIRLDFLHPQCHPPNPAPTTPLEKLSLSCAFGVCVCVCVCLSACRSGGLPSTQRRAPKGRISHDWWGRIAGSAGHVRLMLKPQGVRRISLLRNPLRQGSLQHLQEKLFFSPTRACSLMIMWLIKGFFL